MPTYLRDGSAYCTCCHTKTDVADHTCFLPQSQCTDAGTTSLNADPRKREAWHASHKSSISEVSGMTRPRERPKWKAGFDPKVRHSRGGRLTAKPPRRSCQERQEDDSLLCVVDTAVCQPNIADIACIKVS